VSAALVVLAESVEWAAQAGLEAWAGPAIALHNYLPEEGERVTVGSTTRNIEAAPHIRTVPLLTGLGARHAAIPWQTARQARASSSDAREATSQAIAQPGEPA